MSGFGIRFALIVLVALAAGGSNVGVGASADAPAIQRFSVLADATVDPAHTQLRLGRAKDLRAGTRTRALLRFRLRGVHGFVLRANLSVLLRSGHGVLLVRSAGKKWSEQRVSAANAPRATGPAARGVVGRAGAWTNVDITQFVRGSGTLSLSISSTTPVRLDSREGGHAPRIAVETGPDQPAFPIRAAFYYDWYPEAWSQQGMQPFTHYQPSVGRYDSGNPALVRSHIAAMQYGNITAGIVSWWGQGHPTDSRLAKILSVTTNMHSAFRWAVYYENEAQGDPSVDQIRSDLEYIQKKYGSSPSFLKISRRPVIFVYGDPNDGCAMADRWKQANTIGAYIVLKAFNGYRACGSQPDAWHQYSPAVEAAALSSSYSISPGFFKANEPAPRLARDLDRWRRDVREMTVSSARFHLITTFNEWGEGTAVESAAEWASPSGYGAYLDALHDNGGAGVTPPNTRDAVLFAAGDIASCDSTGDEATAQILAGTSGTIAALGDLAYPSGTQADFGCYNASWGKFKSRTRPAPGNHDYLTAGGSAYYDYFGTLAGDRNKGYYSYSRGAWHIVVINSNCSAVGGCSVGSPQEKWLRANLKATTRRCTLAYWHHPLFSSGGHGAESQMRPIWDDLYRAHAEIVLGGHDHDYERFAPQTPAGAADPSGGIREFVVGTGGKNHDRFGPNVAPNSEVRNSDTFGVLKLTLHPSGYDWKFLPEAGHTFTDSGSGTCH
jgi:hypothetical protein